MAAAKKKKEKPAKESRKKQREKKIRSKKKAAGLEPLEEHREEEPPQTELPEREVLVLTKEYDEDETGQPEGGLEQPEVDLVTEEDYEEEAGGEDVPVPEGVEDEKVARGLGNSRSLLLRPFRKAATRKAIDPQFWEEAEEALIAADAGVDCAVRIVEDSKKRILKEGVKDIEGLKAIFRSEVAMLIESFGAVPEAPSFKPRVLFIVGVNGVGKTTTSAKIGYNLKQQGKKVIYAAADTFRAAGIEQMEMWANRVGFPVVRHRSGGDPAAVVFDAIESASAKEVDVVIVDTAGRLHTKKNLMDELGKMWRVAERQLEVKPEAILVIDATTGQNGITQARIFNEAMEIGSIALTKMDGSAKGGVVLAIGRELGIPVAYIGVGEGMADLRPFNPEEYAAALF